jgi:hypothetical protein
MNDRTREYVATADRHRTAAHFLAQSSTIEPTVREWAVIAAFYAAVHLVNGFLWERLGMEPADHRERTDMVSRVAELRSVRTEYRHLRDAAYVLRYRPGLRIQDDRVQDRLKDLAAIDAVVRTLLDRS